MSYMQTWLMAIRPKTLPAALAPVIVGGAMAFGDGVHHWMSLLMAMIAALLIQIGTNFVNDYADFKKGADTEERIGPVRVTQAGLVDQQTMLGAIILTFLLAAFVCVWLFLRAGWPIAIIAVLSIISGILYTAGPYPLGYLGLGEVFVLIFFGPVAVAGTYYVQSLEMNAAVIIAGIPVGLLSSAILAVNNLRDIEGDSQSGKKTLAVRFGAKFAKHEYIFCILTAVIIPIGIYMMTMDHLYTLMTTLVGLFSIPVIVTVTTKKDGPSLNQALADTGKLLLVYSVLFSVGWIV